jgi:ABC-2 type transport system ATP-binding protein
MEPVIDVRNLNKNFSGRHVVKNLSLRVERGEILGFLGPNGSGKTTSIRMMCGLLAPDSGAGTCLGFDILRESAKIKRRMGYMTQKFSYWDDLTIRENLDFTARIYGIPCRRKVVEETLESLGLASRDGQLAGTLSGGWKQRLALAACLLHKPDLLFLDEPTAGVDPLSRRDFWEELHRLAACGISVLVSTHYMDEAERCHKLAYIAYGELLERGTAREIIGRQGLSTYAIRGGNLAALDERLRGKPGVEQTAVFGETMHATGRDADVLARTVKNEIGNGFARERVESSIEDVFIYLMAKAVDRSVEGGGHE